MTTVKKTLKKSLLFLQTTLILIYLLLEELVWNSIAQPIVKYLKYLNIAKKIELFLTKQNRYIILIIFLLMFVIAEALGLLTPILIAKGFAFMGIVMYGFKIVLATFAFWIFNTQKETLLSFGFINYSYKKITYYIDKIKHSQLYLLVLSKLKEIKLFLKSKYRYYKEIITKKW